MAYRLTISNPMNKDSKSLDKNQGSNFYTIDGACYMN